MVPNYIENVEIKLIYTALHILFQNCQSDGRRWQRILTSEREIRQRLEDMVEQLAKQHSHLEHMVRNATQQQQKELDQQNNKHQVKHRL